MTGLVDAAEPRVNPVTTPVLEVRTLRALVIGFTLYTLLWLVELSWTGLSPPVDSIEQLTWVRSLEWGYYKHPPLPTWLLWGPVQLLGQSAWTSALMGGLVTMSAMGIWWDVLRRLRGQGYARIAMLAALCITYYNLRLNYYNHNVVLLLMVASSAWCCWRAFERRQLRWWVALGAVIGLGALSKYQIAVTVLSVLAFWSSQRGWRERIHVRGLLLAALVALLVFSPHIAWMPAHDFGPIAYAMKSSLGVELSMGARWRSAGHWELDQLLNRCMPALILLCVCARAATRETTTLDPPEPDKAGVAVQPARALIVCWGLLPLVFMPFVGVAFGADLQLQWGSAFLPFVVPVLMELQPLAFWRRVPRALVWQCFVVLQLVLMAFNWVTSPMGVAALREHHHWRSFPSQAVAEAVGPAARVELGGPIRVLIGDAAVAGAVALRLPERPVVLIDGIYERSPWVSRELVAQCGGVEFVRKPDARAQDRAVGPSVPDLYWRVVAPLAGEARCQ